MQLEAVKQDGCAIRYIRNPLEAVQLEAVKQNNEVLELIMDYDVFKRISEQLGIETNLDSGVDSGMGVG